MPIINKGVFDLNTVYLREVGNDWPTAQVLYTQDILETAGNLYYTDTRVNTAVRPMMTTANVIETSANLYFTNARVNTVVQPFLTTANVVETSANLYFTNARVNTAVRPMLTTSNVTETSGSLYFTNQRVFDALSYANLALNNLTVIGDLDVQGNVVTLNTAILTVEDKNITIANGAINAATADGAGIHVAGARANIVYESAGDDWAFNKDIKVAGNVIATGNLIANGLIIRNINVSDSVLAGNVSGVAVTGANILADSVTANIWNRLYTANVIETSGNLYFTTARARASFTAGENITITNGEISAQIGSTVVVNDSTTVIATANTLSYSMGRTITDPKNILVFVEGLTQIPTVDYTVSSSTLILTAQPPVGANIEIRYFGTEAYRTTSPSTLATVNTFNGNGANTNFTLSVSPPGKSYVTVVIDGVTQLADAYEIVGSTLTLSEAPTNGANIDVRIITGVASGPFNTRTYIGDGANTNFTITSGFSNDTVLVFENGVAQVPVTDYTVSGTTLQFITAPAANVVVQIRELGVLPNVSSSSTTTQDTSTNFNVFSFLLGGM